MFSLMYDLKEVENRLVVTRAPEAYGGVANRVVNGNRGAGK
jgi:hypothetical protein